MNSSADVLKYIKFKGESYTLLNIDNKPSKLVRFVTFFGLKYTTNHVLCIILQLYYKGIHFFFEFLHEDYIKFC